MDDLKLIHALPKHKLVELYLMPICDLHGEEFWFKSSPSGKPAPTLVAHIDTVHQDRGSWKRSVFINGKWVEEKSGGKKTHTRVYFDEKQMMMWSPDGLGADDRAGVWGILSIYKELPDEVKPNLLFTDGEESGGTGATEAANCIKEELGTSLFLIQLDRKNGRDAVFYNSEPKEFTEYISKFGFTKCSGSFSDITILGKELKLCGVNLSVGYQEQHTTSEHLCVKTLLRTVAKTKNIVTDAVKKGAKWKNEVESRVVVPRTYRRGRSYDHSYDYAGGYGYQGGFGCYHEDVPSRVNGPFRASENRSENHPMKYPFYCNERNFWIESSEHDQWTKHIVGSRKEVKKKGKKSRKRKRGKEVGYLDVLEERRKERIAVWRRALGLPLSKDEKLDPDANITYGGEGP